MTFGDPFDDSVAPYCPGADDMACLTFCCIFVESRLSPVSSRVPFRVN
uniref:Uncharacterized protein n=1 Tax=Ascaris lumbricoides TaxID=6252 RepID=A0A0M3IT06_ASCLU